MIEMVHFQMISGEPPQVLRFYENTVSCRFGYRIDIEGTTGTNHSHLTVNDNDKDLLPPKFPFTDIDGGKTCHQQDFVDLNSCVVTGENGFQVFFFEFINVSTMNCCSLIELTAIIGVHYYISLILRCPGTQSPSQKTY